MSVRVRRGKRSKGVIGRFTFVFSGVEGLVAREPYVSTEIWTEKGSTILTIEGFNDLDRLKRACERAMQQAEDMGRGND